MAAKKLFVLVAALLAVSSACGGGGSDLAATVAVQNTQIAQLKQTAGSATPTLMASQSLAVPTQASSPTMSIGATDTPILSTPAVSFTSESSPTIVVGGGHTCALTSSGGVKCWGENMYGELGDGTTLTRTVPVDVTGLPSGVRAIATSYYHSCALTSNGKVKCWGSNSSGNLGDGTTTNSSTPVDVVGLPDTLSAIATGGDNNPTYPVAYSCTLTSGGGVKCWGGNLYGELGDGTTIISSTTPVDVCADFACTSKLSGVSAITGGEDHVCALTSSGQIKCWGRNTNGQLGDSASDITSTTPVDVKLSGVIAIAAGGAHTCAQMNAANGGNVKCWGSDFYGELGDGTTGSAYASPTPADVCADATCTSKLSGVIAIAAGWGYTCALMGGGGVKCWGVNYDGELGDGTTTTRSTPVDVCADATCTSLLSGVRAIALGIAHTCALTSNGKVKCWGFNRSGELGDGTVITQPPYSRSTPVDVVGFGDSSK